MYGLAPLIKSAAPVHKTLKSGAVEKIIRARDLIIEISDRKNKINIIHLAKFTLIHYILH